MTRDTQESQEQSEADPESEPTSGSRGDGKLPGGQRPASPVHTHITTPSLSQQLLLGHVSWTRRYASCCLPTAGLGPKLVQSMFVDRSLSSPIWLATENLGQARSPMSHPPDHPSQKHSCSPEQLLYLPPTQRALPPHSLSQGGNKTQRGLVPVSRHIPTTGKASAGNTGLSIQVLDSRA